MKFDNTDKNEFENNDIMKLKNLLKNLKSLVKCFINLLMNLKLKTVFY